MRKCYEQDETELSCYNYRKDGCDMLKKLCLSLAVIISFVSGIFQIQKVKAASFLDINTSTMFFKQNTSNTCTLSSAAMLVRRASLLNGNSRWTEVTENNLRSIAWLSGAGLLNSFSYAGINVSSVKISSNRTQTMIDLLANHPEGIVIYDFEKPHAILLTDYTNGTFYCADPSSAAPIGRIPVSQATITVESIDKYWYVSSPSVSIDNGMHLEMKPNDTYVSSLTDITFSWNLGSADITGYNLYIAPLIEGTINYDWTNARIYLPGYASTQYTVPAGGLKNGSYAAYVEGVNNTNDSKTEASNFLYFVINKYNYTLEPVTLKSNLQTNTFSSYNDIIFSWSKSGVNTTGYNLYIAKYDPELKDYKWDNSRIYLPGYNSTSYTVPSKTLKTGNYAVYVEAWNVVDDVRSNQSNFLFFTIEDAQTHIHDFSWVVDREASQLVVGIKHEECSVCGYKRNEGTVIDKLLTKIPSKTPVVTPTLEPTDDSINASTLVPKQKQDNSSESSITCSKTVYQVTYGTKPFVINATSKSGLSFTSSNPKVASVDKNTGKVTIKRTGIATITASTGEDSVKVTVRVSPKRQSVKSVKASKGRKLTVKWAKDQMATGYQVQISTSKKFMKIAKQRKVKKNNFTFTKLKAGKKYYVRIRSYKKSGKETLYGAWGKVRKSSKVKQ